MQAIRSQKNVFFDQIENLIEKFLGQGGQKQDL